MGPEFFRGANLDEVASLSGSQNRSNLKKFSAASASGARVWSWFSRKNRKKLRVFAKVVFVGSSSAEIPKVEKVEPRFLTYLPVLFQSWTFWRPQNANASIVKWANFEILRFFGIRKSFSRPEGWKKHQKSTPKAKKIRYDRGSTFSKSKKMSRWPSGDFGVLKVAPDFPLGVRSEERSAQYILSPKGSKKNWIPGHFWAPKMDDPRRGEFLGN